MKSPLVRTGLMLAALWAVMYAAVALCRPLMPVDETRYMSVAWEMWVRHSYLLPTLNFEPYSHKPPMLFWLINLIWSVTGPQVWSARIVSFGITAAFVGAAVKFSRKIAPQQNDIGVYTMLALAAMPMFLIYGSVIMFDTLMGVWVTLAMMVIWDLAQSEQRGWKDWAKLGVLIGLGILAKGPVALVYMLPAALLAPFWAPNIKDRWYAGIGMAVLIGAAIALAWAIPAVIEGGPEYGDKIFVTQSAGRMVNAFDHRRPFWFYGGVLTAYLVPFLIWPTMWSSVKQGLNGFKRDHAVRFLVCWIVPVFVFFSAISSKQFHYMTPLLPGFAILAGLAIARADLPRPLSVAVPMFLMLVPSIVIIIFEAMHKPFMGIALSEASENFGYLHVFLSMAIFAWAKKFPRYAMHALCLASLVLAIMIHIQLSHRFLPQFDMAPLARGIDPYRDRPLAAAPKYDGEYGYTLGLTKHVDSIGRENIDAWFAKHPDGIVIARYDNDHIPDKYDVVFQQDFRKAEVLMLLQRKVMVGMK